MNTHGLLARLLIAATTLSALPALAAETGELWEISNSMKMAGMEMPATTSRACAPKGKQEQALKPDKGDCKMQNIKNAGNRTSFTMVCDGKDGKMTGTGELVSLGPDAHKGNIQLKGTMGGEPVDMTQSWSAKRVGSCTPTDTAALVAASETASAKALVQGCEPMMGVYYVQAFEKGGQCESQRKAFCTRVDKESSAMSQPEAYARTMGQVGASGQGSSPFEGALKFCGARSLAVITVAACKNAVSGNNFNFIADYCPAEATTLAATNCEGRSYTTVMQGPYGRICSKYSERFSRANNSGSGSQTTGAAKPLDADTLIKDGASKLKGLLGF